MEGFEHFLDTEAGKDLPDLNAPLTTEQVQTSAADVVAEESGQAPAVGTETGQTTTQAEPDKGAPASGTEVTTQFDSGKFLEEVSGGRYKTKEEITTALQQLDQAAALQKQVDDWKAKYGENPYADPFEEQRNLLKKQGATENQLKELEEITKIGDLTALSPLEVRVKAMVIRDNVTPEFAERVIKEQFKLDDFLNDDDKSFQEQKLALSAKDDVKFLQEYKQKLAVVDNTTKQLQMESARNEARQALGPIGEAFKKNFSELKDFNINGAKKPEDVLNFTFKTPDDFMAAVPKLVEAYIVDQGKPVNDETIAEANTYVENMLWATQGKKFVTDAVNHAIAATTEKITAKYENRSPLNDDHRAAPVVETDEEFWREVAR